MQNLSINPAKPVEAVKCAFKFPFERRARSLSNPKQVELSKEQEQTKKKSPSPECQIGDRNEKSHSRGPVIAKTDFSLHQQMMGIGKCKDLDEWLMGSGESAETADSKGNPQLKFGVKNKQNSLVQPTAVVQDNDCEVDSEKEGDEEDWMFRTFDKAKLGGKPQAEN